MKGIIVLEGADGTGKTTLARELVKRYGAFYIHNGLWPNMWQRHLAAVDLAVKKSQRQLVIIDRLYLSEQIYGQVFRAGPAYDLGARCLDRVLQRHGALTVLCVRQNLKAHLEHFEKLKRTRPEKFASMKLIAQRYLDLLKGNLAYKGNFYVNQLTRSLEYANRCDVMSYDMDRQGDRLGDVCTQIVDRLETCRDYPLSDQYDDRRPNLAGHPATTRYLFVGEELSPRACSRAAPFLWSDELSAASWLNARLRELDFDETLGLWTNAISTDDWLKTARRELSTAVTIIALGKVAEQRVRKLDFPNVRSLPHPQWCRRFQTHSPEIFRRQLKEALA